LLPTCFSVEPINPRNVRAWDQVPVKVHSDRNRAVPELVANIRQARPVLQQLQREGVAEIVNAKVAQAGALDCRVKIPRCSSAS
jgi:hypothetical protein